MNILTEAKRLYDLGFAVIPLHPKSKRPKFAKWTSGPRSSWADFLKGYKAGDNIGVRLGSPSKIGKNYLACFDIDVHEKAFEVKAEKFLLNFLNGQRAMMPEVTSGSGTGSKHLYCVTKAPFKMLTLLKEKGGEICLYSTGRQMVLSSSIHPTTNRPYKWKTPVNETRGFPLIEMNDLDTSVSTGINLSNKNMKVEYSPRESIQDFTPEVVDIEFCDELEPSIINEIIDATDVEDRSASLFKVVFAMLNARWTDKQILSCLTDTRYALGKVAYEHAKTDSRQRAADWLYNYTIKKARRENDAKFHFDDEVEVIPLNEEATKIQELELVVELDWRLKIERYGDKGVNAGRPKPTLANVSLILSKAVIEGTFIRDTFAMREVYGHVTPWGGKKHALLTDADTTKIKSWLSSTWKFEPKDKEINDAVLLLVERHSFDPVRDALESLPEWDGVNRIDGWLHRNFEAEGHREYLAQVFRKWLVAMVMRVYEPGAKFDWIPIFEGRQGIGKSSFGRLLVGDKHFLDWLPDLSNKDSALMLQGIWLVELGELAALRKWDLESAKSFITRTVDKFRPPFGKRVIEVPRRCVFFGTTNADTYLKDETGNRRFKPVKVGNLNFDALRTERPQLFAEALFIYKNNLETERTLYLEGDAKTAEIEIQASKMIEDDSDVMLEVLEEFIQRELRKKEPQNRFPFHKFKTSWLFETKTESGRGSKCFDQKGDQRHLNFATKAIKAIGGKRTSSKGFLYWKIDPLPTLRHQAEAETVEM